METTQQETVVGPSAPPPPGILATKFPVSAAFLLATLLFLLPFAEIRCNGTPVANNTGVGIAMGSEWKEMVTKNIFGQPLDTNDSRREYGERQNPNVFAITALALGLIGFLIALLSLNGGGKVNVFVALLAVASLIGMLIDLKSKAKSDTSVKSSDLNVNMGVKITVDGTGWFYLVLVLFFAAAFFSWQRNKMNS
jgi:hypothetical protein